MAAPQPSPLDASQCIKGAYDDDKGRLRVDTGATIDLDGELEVAISQTSDSIRIGDGVDLVTTTTVGPDVGLDVNIVGGVVTGTFTPSGLTLAIKSSRVSVGAAATALPAMPLANRNGVSFRNLGPGTIYIGDSSVTASTGYPKFVNEEVQLDARNSIIIYATCATGESASVAVMEIA